MSSHRPFLLRTVRHLLRDLMALVRLGLTSRAHLAAENLFLRKQLALYQERRTKPRRSDPATRVTLVCHTFGQVAGFCQTSPPAASAAPSLGLLKPGSSGGPSP